MRLINAAPLSSDDRSNQKERILIGVIGLVLPLVLYLLAAWRPEFPSSRWTLLPSISAYYYTGAVAAFVGLLVTLAIFLFAYQGYENHWQRLDLIAARVAAVAAIAVAFFPTGKPQGYPITPWWRQWMEYVHSAGAAVLFCSFAFFALYLFRRTGPDDPDGQSRTQDKQRRDRIYFACGIAILLAIIWACVIGLMNYYVVGGNSDRPIFWPECTALIFFAFSWLTKGHLDKVRLVPNGNDGVRVPNGLGYKAPNAGDATGKITRADSLTDL
jgi:hypothetical protein